MFANSSPVSSVQRAPHARLGEIVRRHVDTPFKRTPSAAGRAAFDGIGERIGNRPWILDAGCGTGASSMALAARFASHLVIGIDKSAARLASRHDAPMPENLVLSRCDLVDFWHLAAQHRWRCDRQFLWYPNPWPKPDHVRRRWHGHPIFPAIVALGPLELRTNWRVYADEFRDALVLMDIPCAVASIDGAGAVTPFERKYAASGHALFKVETIAG